MTTSRSFALLCTIGVFCFISYNMVRMPVLALFAESLGASPERIGLIVSVSTLTGVFLKLPSGALSEHLWPPHIVAGRRHCVRGPPIPVSLYLRSGCTHHCAHVSWPGDRDLCSQRTGNRRRVVSRAARCGAGHVYRKHSIRCITRALHWRVSGACCRVFVCISDCRRVRLHCDRHVLLFAFDSSSTADPGKGISSGAG